MTSQIWESRHGACRFKLVRVIVVGARIGWVRAPGGRWAPGSRRSDVRCILPCVLAIPRAARA
jgi:hypothetical protein